MYVSVEMHYHAREPNHCNRKAQSLCGGCSRRVHKKGYLAVKKGNIMVNFLLLKILITNYYHLLILNNFVVG